MATCRNCKHYDLEAFRLSNGKLRVTSNSARFLFDGLDRIRRKLPASYNSNFSMALGWMAPDHGNGCPQWTKRDE